MHNRIMSLIASPSMYGIAANALLMPAFSTSRMIVTSNWLNALNTLISAAAYLRADLRPVIVEELIKASPSIGIERRTPLLRDNPAKIAHCPQRVEKEPIFPERLSVRSELEVMGQQFFGTRPNQRLTTADPFWHHEIAALEGHNNRKLVANVVVQLHDGCNVPNRIANLERGL